MSNEQKNKPHVIRNGNIKANIWENESDNGTYHTVTLAKTYEDKDGNLKDSHTLYQSDLLQASNLANEAYNHIRDAKRDLSPTRNNDERRGFEEQRRNHSNRSRERDNQR